MWASQSVAIDANGFRVLRDVGPGEAVFIDQGGRLHTQQCAPHASLNPCIFEYVYLARPDSIIDGASVYETRLNMGRKLAEKIRRSQRRLDIDVVIPIPDSGRPAALQLAAGLGVAYREGFVKNRYIGSTFIMPGQAVRARSVRQKLNPMSMEFAGKNVMLVDDSIVRGTTSREIVQMARDSGARKVFFASAAPPVRFPNVYGIDMPTRAELIAAERAAGDRPRRPGVPGPGGAEGRRAPGQPAARELRDLVLRRGLRHRRRDQRLPARDRSPARRQARLRRRRQCATRFKSSGLIYSFFPRRFEPQLAGA